MANCIILAAGEGTRLRPYTTSWPKCLMPIHGKPLMEYWLSDLFELNLNKIFVNVSYLRETVTEYLSRERFLGKVEVLEEKALLGTAGTILSIKDQLRDSPTLVIHADNWCGMRIGELVEKHDNFRPSECKITMMTFDSENPQSCGVVELDEAGVVRGFYEKVASPPTSIANAAVYVLEPEVINWMGARQVSDLSNDVLPNFVGKIFCVHNHSFHRDIGSIESLRKANLGPKKQIIWDTDDDWLNDFKSNPIHEAIK